MDKPSEDSKIEYDSGPVLVVISRRWKRTVATLLYVLIGTNVLLGLLLARASSRMIGFDNMNEKSLQRAEAMAEMVRNRSEINVFSYNKACEFAKARGQSCLLEPRWWADPSHFPLIANDPMGQGLFPPKDLTPTDTPEIIKCCNK